VTALGLWRPVSRALLVTSCLFALVTTPAPAAPAGFYTLNERWEKSSVDKGSQREAVDDGFRSALENSGPPAPGGVPAPAPLRLGVAEITAVPRTLEIELRQTLVVGGFDSLRKFVSTEESVVTLENEGLSSLRVLGTAIGRTFVHAWDASGRHTFEVQVLQPRFTPTSVQRRQMDESRRSRSFRMGYEGDRGSFHSGTKFQDMNRTSLDMSHKFTVEGDTPYGVFAAHTLGQKAQDRTILTDLQASLKDTSVGPLREIDVYAGDSPVRPAIMALPSVRVRGGVVEHTKEASPLRWTSFYGREQTSLLGTLTPGIVQKRTVDSFLGGGVADYRLNDDAKVRAGYFQAYGQSRAEELNGRGMGARGDFAVGPHLTLRPEVDFDDARFAQQHSATLKVGRVQLRQEFRDISKKFQTLIGAPSRQGELGFKTDLEAGLTEYANLSGSFDVFRDRLIPNPEAIERWNAHRELMLTLTPAERTSLILTYQDIDDTGRIGPTKQRAAGVQFNRQFTLWDHNYTLFTRYQNRGSRILSNSELNYVQNQALLGFRTELFWGVYFSLQKEWNVVEEPNLRRITHPSALTYGLEYERRLGLTPLYLDLRFRMRDEEETESPNSFMSGEDSTELSFGLYYRESEDWELFLTGGFENFVPESLSVLSPRVEARLLTGVKYQWDTGVRWNVVGSFEGSVFKDTNGDGVRQEGESGIEGMTVRTEGGEHEARTGPDGRYTLPSVSGRSAAILLDTSNVPYGHTPTGPSRLEFTIEQGKAQRADFGLAPRSEVTGIVFNDLDGDGEYDLTDTGVRKVKVTLDGAAARTNQSGVYVFSDVLAGEHTVSLDFGTLPEGFLPSGKLKRTVTVFEGIRYELHFPLRAQRALTGRVFLDKNHNGVLEPGEDGIGRVRVQWGGLPVLTDEEGWYLFPETAVGEQELTVDPATLPAGTAEPAARRLRFGIEPATLTENLPVTPKKTLLKTDEREPETGDTRKDDLPAED